MAKTDTFVVAPGNQLGTFRAGETVTRAQVESDGGSADDYLRLGAITLPGADGAAAKPGYRFADRPSAPDYPGDKTALGEEPWSKQSQAEAEARVAAAVSSADALVSAPSGKSPRELDLEQQVEALQAQLAAVPAAAPTSGTDAAGTTGTGTAGA